MRRLLLSLTAVLPFLAAILIQFIAYSLVEFLYSFCTGIQSAYGQPGNAQVAGTAPSQETIYLFSVFGIVVSGIVFFFWYKKEIVMDYYGSGEILIPEGDVNSDESTGSGGSIRFNDNIKRVFSRRNLGVLFALGAGCQFCFSGLMGLVTPYFPKQFSDYAATMQDLNSGNVIVVLLLMSMIAPITEELIFRGVILHMAGRYTAFLGANMIQAVLFGIYHGNVIQGIYAAILGFLLGLIYHKFNTIFASMLLHIFINLSSFLLFPIHDNIFSYTIVMLGGIVLIAESLYRIKPTHRDK